MFIKQLCTPRDMLDNMNNQTWIVKNRVSDDVYTNREELLAYYYKVSLQTAERLTMSNVLLGYRRMGKTEIFRRVVNKLFFEQNKKSPKAVVPIYYTFSDHIKDDLQFSIEYLENFLRFYLGFYLNDPELIKRAAGYNELKDIANNAMAHVPSVKTLKWILDTIETIATFPVPAKVAVELPRRVSDIDDTSIVVFLDEFQNATLPQFDFSVVGYYQEGADSPTCPHFVTGSAMSILLMEMVGKGPLFGRFKFKRIEVMTSYYSSELALKVSHRYNADINADIAPVIAERCGGNPYYITAVIQHAVELQRPLRTEEDINDILAIDITSGFIWGELCDQLNKWITRINPSHITKWILYLASLEESYRDDDPGDDKEIDLNKIQKALKEKERVDVEISTIRDIMVMLSRGDLLECKAFSFYRIKDPILCDFLKVWGKIEMDKMTFTRVKNDLRNQYYHFSKRSLDEYKGYLGEIHMSQILLASQRKGLPGKWFHQDQPITMPDFSFVNHRVRLSSGLSKEIDLLGAAGPEAWVCQSKWVENTKIGSTVLKRLLQQSMDIKERMNLVFMKKWLFAHDGLTKDAELFAHENHIYWSDRADLDALLNHLNLRPLYSFGKSRI
ncbi:MAG: hypothetical protein HQK75_20325 [Candidatus Magnetomorum sp.]|nr:hypothetical protein [Candidatus Magnetomorum sp.]